MAELVDNSEKVRREIRSRLVVGLNNANEFLINEARSEAPVKSGALRDGLEIVQEASESALVAIGAAKAPHSAIVNRGTAHTEAKPFWSSAWIRMKTGFDRFFK